MFSSDGFLIIAVKLKDKENICMATRLLFYIILSGGTKENHEKSQSG
jgi:hypothetical protein